MSLSTFAHTQQSTKHLWQCPSVVLTVSWCWLAVLDTLLKIRPLVMLPYINAVPLWGGRGDHSTMWHCASSYLCVTQIDWRETSKSYYSMSETNTTSRWCDVCSVSRALIQPSTVSLKMWCLLKPSLILNSWCIRIYISFLAIMLMFLFGVYFKIVVSKRDIKELQAFCYWVSITCSCYSIFSVCFSSTAD